MLVSFRAAKMQTNTGNVPFSRVIGFTRNETIFIASLVSCPRSYRGNGARFDLSLYKFHTRVFYTNHVVN